MHLLTVALFFGFDSSVLMELCDVPKYAGDFGVDKEAQAKVAASMDKFLKEDGGLLLYVIIATSENRYRLVF